MKRIIKFILSILVFLNIIAWTTVFHLSQPRVLKVVFFDVGQGDSIFIETPQRLQVLIDGGPDLTVLEKLAKEMPFYDRTIDLLILSHPEKDHLFGLLEVLKRYKVKNILWTGIIRNTAEWQEWKNLIEKERAEIKIAEAGQKIILQENPLVLFNILYPFENLDSKEVENSNDTSIIASLIFGAHSLLFTGDITKKTEQELIAQDVYLNSVVLKIAHHGSKTSSSEEFLESVSPEVAVLSVGENKYGHPSPEVLANFEKFGIPVLITKEVGDIKIISDGEKYKISNF
ncbi:MAG: hypothetical protein COU42_01790 [Candidatus Nealsonbacteria bacterium CG10_big_fil_rev_8_21_14_0_10_36_24]|uniref:Metallo-beta-lactamase domain-containing protein n=2 Tax=Candidatus Nealsoniibacteriota TaxID=1817911 RepID=A0A2M6NS79_9BACT|nr:MAG: hypothetical protein COU42_01790 [Candidatus Nealsonbacteria bacterium CG10_big_fil_rev_8_21_14_0_10_36_24]